MVEWNVGGVHPRSHIAGAAANGPLVRGGNARLPLRAGPVVHGRSVRVKSSISAVFAFAGSAGEG
jgi:hypothetical protein